MDQGLEERTNQFNNACQVLVGIAHFDDGLSPVGSARGFVDCLPEPRGRYEALFYRGRLLDMALMWAEGAHLRAHRDIGTLANPCVFSAAELTRRLWTTSDESPKTLFAGWAEGFFPALERDHAPRVAARAARLLAQDFAAPLNVPRLARQCGAHVAVLRRAFKHDFGVTIRSYHINVRVLEAVRLLPDRRYDGRSLAAAVGYRSCKNFYRAVRKVTGLSLRELRSIPHAEALERARLPTPLR